MIWKSITDFQQISGKIRYTYEKNYSGNSMKQ